jgi:DNA-binding transcriptional LysR family regulator
MQLILIVCLFFVNNITMDQLTRLKVFIHVVETGSFSAASERMGLSRAAASKYVSQLEEHLGGRLLNRTTRHVSTTESGRLYFERCKEILHNLEEADGMVSGLSGQPRGTLRISCPTYFASKHLLPLLHDFNQHYPAVNVELMCAERIVDLVDEGYDLAIRITDAPDPELIARRLARCRHVIVASPGYLANSPPLSHPEDLQRHACIMYAYTAGGIWPLTKEGKKVSIKISPTVKTNNPDVLLEAAVSGMGVALMPSFLASDTVRSGALQLVLEDYQTIEMNIYVVYASRHHLPAKIRVFIDYLKDRIIDPPYWDHFLNVRC